MSLKAMVWAWQSPVKGNTKLTLLALADHSDDDGNCWPGLKGLAEKCGISRASVIEHINRLEKLGLIAKQKRHDENGYRRSNIYVLNINQSPEIQRRENLRRNFASLSPDLPLSKVKNLDGNIIEPVIESTIEPSNIREVCKTSPSSVSKPKPSKEQKLPAEALEIFQYWKKVMDHPRAKLDDKRKRRIMQALKSYSAEDLKEAINGCAKTPFNMGQNDSNQKYNDLELILRDAKRIEQFINANSIVRLQKPGASRLTHQNDVFAGAI
jgi:DNA-binding MarR family transcriptional regulator